MYFLKNLIVDKISFITKGIPAVSGAETSKAIFKSKKKRLVPQREKSILAILRQK